MVDQSFAPDRLILGTLLLSWIALGWADW